MAHATEARNQWIPPQHHFLSGPPTGHSAGDPLPRPTRRTRVRLPTIVRYSLHPLGERPQQFPYRIAVLCLVPGTTVGRDAAMLLLVPTSRMYSWLSTDMMRVRLEGRTALECLQGPPQPGSPHSRSHLDSYTHDICSLSHLLVLSPCISASRAAFSLLTSLLRFQAQKYIYSWSIYRAYSPGTRVWFSRARRLPYVRGSAPGSRLFDLASLWYLTA